jgi:peptidoglycan-associated lipoprotein
MTDLMNTVVRKLIAMIVKGGQMKKLFAVFIIAGFVIAGCAQRKMVASEEGLAQQPREMTQAKKDDQKKAAEKITEQRVAEVKSQDVASKTEEISGMFPDIYFDFDVYDIREDARPVLKSMAAYLGKNSYRKALVEGHCDERGTNEYNLALGDRRAKATKDYLVSLGIPSSRIETISYGEEKPDCREQTEECQAKNRRAHFILSK